VPGRALAAVVVLASVLGVGCGGQERKARPPALVTAEQGRFVAIGGGRTLYITCVGSGSPAVVLEAGAGANTRSWEAVQPAVGRETRTCAYDRAGTGSSVAPPGVRDARDEMADLRRLLARARVKPPYVLVGHSYGGVLARMFARRYPSETAGLVLIDTMGRDGRRRQLAVWPRSQGRESRRLLATTVLEGVDLAVGEAIASRVKSLHGIPLAVVTAGHEAVLPRRPARLHRTLIRLWMAMQDELAGLSPNSVHVVALASDHDVLSPRAGQPAVIVRAVRAVVRAARSHAQLPPCRRLFTGPGVRCRG
jgi:pimeloyl-ACP methyl ester carboxylesterase